MTSHDTENKRIKRKIKFDNGLRKHKENCTKKRKKCKMSA